MATAYSSLHTQKPPRRPTPKSKPRPPPPPHLPTVAQMLPSASVASDTPPTSRTSSLAGRKRPRESDGDGKLKPRRTKSQGDQSRDAFQRGLIAVFVPNALRDSVRGDMGGYNELLAYFLPTPLQPTPSLSLLLPLVRTLAANVSLLAPVHGSLVSAIISLPWATDDKFVRAFIGWAGVLVSARPEYTKELVTMAVKGLTWQFPSFSHTSRRIFHARHHLLLSHLLSLVPTLPNTLGPLLHRHFPHKREREVVQTTYLRNICELTAYCPELRARLWSDIVDKMLRIDVEITKAGDDDEDEDEFLELLEASNITSDPFDLLLDQDIPLDPIVREKEEVEEQDIDDLSSAEESVSGDEEDEEQEAIKKARTRLAVLLNRRKLDGMMACFIKHLGEVMGYRSSSPPAAQLAASSLSSGQSTPTTEFPSVRPLAPAESLAAFQTLLDLFTRQVLQTSATQHVPFLLFITSSYTPAHTDLFLGLLVSLSLYGSSPLVQAPSLRQRTAATVYIGSIACRARYVTDDQARQVLKYLLAYIDGTRHHPDSHEMPLFYAVCQAAMLIFCFRWRAFKREDEVLGEIELDDVPTSASSEWMPELEVLSQAIMSDLNPLLGCNQTISSTFANIAHETDFLYCYSIMESNSARTRRPPLSARNTSQNLSLPRDARRVNIDSGFDGYFPFDPYDLPRSGEAIEALYRTWDEVALDRDEDSDDDDDEDDDEETEGEVGESVDESATSLMSHHAHMRMAGTGASLDRRRALKEGGVLSTSFEGMSISPHLAGIA